MKISKLLFALVVTSLISFGSCTKEEVDPKIGTWHSATETTPFGDVYVEVIYSESNTMKINVKSNPSNALIGGTTASWVKSINSTTDLYEITSATALGSPTTVDEPFYKVSTTIDGSTMDYTSYEPDSTAAGAEAVTATDLEGELEKQ